jgi:hypothetical protein
MNDKGESFVVGTIMQKNGNNASVKKKREAILQRLTSNTWNQRSEVTRLTAVYRVDEKEDVVNSDGKGADVNVAIAHGE